MSTGIVLLAAILGAPGTTAVRGIVCGPDGRPVEKADVWLFDRQAYTASDGLAAPHVTTAADGRFAFDLPGNAPFGRNYAFDVFAHKPGAGMAVADVDARVLPAPMLTMNLLASAPRELLIVDPGGKPAQNARVTVQNFSDVSLRCNCWLPTAGTPEPFSHRTNARGEVAFDFCDPLRSFSLIVDVPGYGRQMLSRLEDGSNKPLQLARAGKLRGRLVGADPKLTAGALVWINSMPLPAGAVMGRANVRTDAQGRFEVAALAAGEVRVSAIEHAPDSSIFLQKELMSTLKAGETVDIEVPVVRGVRVFGKVIDEESSKSLSAARAHVSLTRGGQGITSWSVLTDDDGRYEVYVPPGAGPGFVQVGPLPDSYLPAHADSLFGDFPAEGDELEMPDFVVRRGITLTGTVVDAEQRPVVFAQVQAAAIDVSKQHYHCVVTDTDAEGRFSIGPVDADLILTLMAADETRASSKALPVEPWKTQRGIVLPIDASATAELSGRVVDADGEPIADAWIHAGPDMGSGNWEYDAMRVLRPISTLSTKTDKRGKYVLPNRVPLLGRYYIQATGNGFVTKRLPLDGSDLPPGKQTLEDLVLEREKQK